MSSMSNAAAPRAIPVHLTHGALASLAVALAVGSSSIVFSEPAAADVLMAGVIVGVPLLGAARFGRMAIANFSAWLAIVALGIAATAFSVNFDTAIKHQLVTLYLAAGAFVLAGFISAAPEPRIRLVLMAYMAASLAATVAALVGYFQLLPGAYDLFTNFGRARGTFKDPNVYGAAITPALAACVWAMLREERRLARPAAGAGLLLALGLLLCFSRGAWLAAMIAVAGVIGIALATSRRRTDYRRLKLLAGLGSASVVAALLAVSQIEQVRTLLEVRASLDQSYDVGPEGRFGGQAKARRLIVENPLGIGTHTFRDAHHAEEPHNVYLSMFLNAGWLGGFLYIGTVGATLLVGVRRSLAPGAMQGPMLIATAAFAGLVIEGWVIDTDHWRSFFILLAAVWGIADATAPAIESGRRRGDPLTSHPRAARLPRGNGRWKATRLAATAAIRATPRG